MVVEGKCQVRHAEEAKSSSSTSEINNAAAPAGPAPTPPPSRQYLQHTQDKYYVFTLFLTDRPAFQIFLKQTRPTPAWTRQGHQSTTGTRISQMARCHNICQSEQTQNDLNKGQRGLFMFPERLGLRFTGKLGQKQTCHVTGGSDTAMSADGESLSAG